MRLVQDLNFNFLLFTPNKMYSSITAMLGGVQQRNRLLARLSKFLVISGLVLFVIYVLLSTLPGCQTSPLHPTLNQKWRTDPDANTQSSIPTNISHLVFGIVGSANTWVGKRHYIESWWKPNITRGYLYLDRAPIEHLPWPPTSPPARISGDTSRYNAYNQHRMPFAIRMVRVIEETFKEGDDDVRWYIMADDDTVLFIDNLVEVLSRYDHTKHFYIGMNSECVISNFYNSFDMAFGGAGYALSYPLARALAKNLDVCIKRYPTLFGSDHILQSCVSDLGVSLTHNRGFHQIDLHYDISGLLSAHPQTPFLSLHHLDAVNPLFPSMNRYESLNHLMEAAKTDQSRLLQQSVCYHKQNNWTFSVAWGYTAHVYEKLIPPSILRIPLQTFGEWRKGARPAFMFNTRWLTNDPCEAPHVFHFNSVEKMSGNYITTSYIRGSPRGLSACSSSGNHSADEIFKIIVISPVKPHSLVGTRRECCDVEQVGANTTLVNLRTCLEDELVG